MRKPPFCIYAKTKAQLSFAVTAKLIMPVCFRYTDSTIPLLSKSKITSIKPSSVLVQLGLCRTGSEPRCWFFHEAAH